MWDRIARYSVATFTGTYTVRGDALTLRLDRLVHFEVGERPVVKLMTSSAQGRRLRRGNPGHKWATTFTSSFGNDWTRYVHDR